MTLEHGHVAGAQRVLLFEDGIAHEHDLEGAEVSRGQTGKTKEFRPVMYRKLQSTTRENRLEDEPFSCVSKGKIKPYVDTCLLLTAHLHRVFRNLIGQILLSVVLS